MTALAGFSAGVIGLIILLGWTFGALTIHLRNGRAQLRAVSVGNSARHRHLRFGAIAEGQKVRPFERLTFVK
jgi:hypothetical protein